MKLLSASFLPFSKSRESTIFSGCRPDLTERKKGRNREKEKENILVYPRGIKHAMANPCSLFVSAGMVLEHLVTKITASL